MDIRRFDVAVIGGGTGGVQAARAACEMGRRVYLCESTDWVGGQLTSQAVPPDEHFWIEEQGATQSYLQYRRDVRDCYRNDPFASDDMKNRAFFCPGQSWVSRIAHSPKLAHQLLMKSLQPHLASGMLTLELNTVCTNAEVFGDRIHTVTVHHADGSEDRIEADYFLDATDCGDLLALSGTEYSIGAESKAETGERHAPEQANPQDQQPITWVAALAMDKERQPMKKPDSYDDFSSRITEGVPHLGWQAYTHAGLRRYGMFNGDVEPNSLGLWTYRRIQYPPFYTDDRPEISLLNWPQNDYLWGNVIDDPNASYHLQQARELTLCCAYWLWEQGYPVRLDGEPVGTKDGLAKAPYIRESRRLKAKHTIVEEEVAECVNPTPVQLADSVGVGQYAMDLHLTTQTHTTMYQPAKRFEIPLSAMIPVRMKNLLPAAKNIGATHVTGGCFRLHPVEWTVGEAAGTLSCFCLERGCTPGDVLDHHLKEFQSLLVSKGFQLHWKL